MSEPWSIKPDWALLETGSLEERAGFATLEIHAFGVCLTAGHDRLLQSICQAPYLSAYHLAEWLAWNWWRLRWEPHKKNSVDWALSHAMASVGGGYIWPDIRFFSDGRDITLLCDATSERISTPYRYINGGVGVLSAAEFEGEVDRFIGSVLQRMKVLNLESSNLHEVWREVLKERSDPVLYEKRKIEALLGEDPGEMDETVLQDLLNSATMAGQTALEEIAADHQPGQAYPDIERLFELGRKEGTSASRHDRVCLQAEMPQNQDAAWKIGAQAAQLLRTQERLEPDVPIMDQRLAELYGVSHTILDTQSSLKANQTLSFSLSEASVQERVILKGKWKTGRRFELARLLGDVLTCPTQDPLRPVTRSYMYRQKIQRAFAAELLSPFASVDSMLAGDYSLENQQEVAQHFHVSELTIRTLLVNHRRIDRQELAEAELAYS